MTDRQRTSGEPRRRHDDDVLALGDRVADELLRLSLAAEVVPAPVPDLRLTPDVAETAPKHTGTAYGCPACAAAANA
jgi:hypothetical protein